MIWLGTNVVLSMLALAFAYLNASAPHRLRFLVGFFALCAWLIPWSRIGELMPSASVIPDALPGGVKLMFDPVMPPTDGGAGNQGLTSILISHLDVVALILTALGAVLFAVSSIRYRQLVKRLSLASASGTHLWRSVPWETVARGSSDDRPDLRIQAQVPGAMTTGVWIPTIWVHESLVNNRQLAAALIHEYRHARNRDNVYLWAITFIECLFWWNPLTRHLAKQTRNLQELSCDEACAVALPNYREMLTELLLNLSGRAALSCPQSPGIHRSSSFNIERLRALERRYAMKLRHYLSIAVLSIGSFLAVGWATAQDVSVQATEPVQAAEPPSSRERQRLIEEVLGPALGFDPGTTLQEAERMYVDLRVYVALLERQYAQQETEIEALRQEVETLRAESDEVN